MLNVIYSQKNNFLYKIVFSLDLLIKLCCKCLYSQKLIVVNVNKSHKSIIAEIKFKCINYNTQGGISHKIKYYNLKKF